MMPVLKSQMKMMIMKEEEEEEGREGRRGRRRKRRKKRKKKEEKEEEEEEGRENSEVTNIKRVQHGQEIGVKTVTETKNIDKVRHVENQTKHSHGHQHHQNHKGDQQRGKKKAKELAATTVATEESVGQNKPGEKKFDKTLFEEHDSESSHGNTLVTTEHSRFHHQRHHISPTSGPHFYIPNLTTDQPAHVDSTVEVTLDSLDFNFTEGPSTEYSAVLNPSTSKPTSQQKVKLPKVTASSEKKVRCFLYILYTKCINGSYICPPVHLYV